MHPLFLHILSFSSFLQVLFDKDGCLRKYSSVLEVLHEFYELRLDMYRRRKEWLEGQLTAESSKLSSQARFIVEKIEGKIVIGWFDAQYSCPVLKYCGVTPSHREQA